MWDMQWTKWQWDRLISQYSVSPANIIPQIPNSFTPIIDNKSHTHTYTQKQREQK